MARVNSHAGNAEENTVPYDVLICGAGLAGLTLARQLLRAEPALKVALIDRLTRPLPPAALKVGESTVEVGSHYLAKILDLESLLEARHVRKLGLRFFFGDPRGPFESRPELGPSHFLEPFSYQIDRGVLEQELRGLVESAGAHLFEGCAVSEVELSESAAPHVVCCHDAQGERLSLSGRWLIDATGRRRLLQKKLGTAQRADPRRGAAWFRLATRFDVGDFVPKERSSWHQRVPKALRYNSTNHICGPGYWIWIIALGSGYTSVGVVSEQSIHPTSSYGTWERMLSWLEQNEPTLACHLQGITPTDFVQMPRYSYRCQRVFSEQRWACVGEAGAFPDPFYSPGTDLIGFGNTLATHLIVAESAGWGTVDAKRQIEDYNDAYLSFSNGLEEFITSLYGCLGNGTVTALKVLWDTIAGWGFSAPLMYNDLFADPGRRKSAGVLSGRFYFLGRRMQQLFLDWATQSKGRVGFEYIDYFALPFLVEVRERNLKPGKDQETLKEDHRRNLALLEELAQVLFLLAVDDTQPARLPEALGAPWLNAWGVGLDASRWEQDSLFTPKTYPRCRARIAQQLAPMMHSPGGVFSSLVDARTSEACANA